MLHRVVFLSHLFLLSICLFAVKDESNQDRWEKPVGHGPDAVVPGFLVNLGPTGARAILKTKSFVVKYIFKESPAYGNLQLNDEIVGVNGKEFNSHTFSGDKNLGIEGPIYDLGYAIENAEGSDGILRLMVKRRGSSVEVQLQLEKLGSFSNTFPENCSKAKLLHKRALDYLAKKKPKMGIDGRCAAILALISSNDKQHQQAGKDLVMGLNSVPGTGTWSWNLAFRCIALAEYHLITQDSSVLPALKGTLDLLRKAQYKGSNIHIWKAKEGQSQEKINAHSQLYEGGFGHAPFTNGYGKGGYGPMQPPTILAVIAWQLGKKCGIPVKHEGIEKALQFMNYGTNDGGNVAYGGEFTLNNGPIDHVRWKQSTRRGNAQKSGLSILAYNLSPEYKKTAAYLKLHKENMHATFKGMANGHADGIMAMTWGMLGTGASGDEKLKRKVFDYFKIWLNMTRCHGSDSYVALPGRDYADGAYYRDHRSHVTAMAALMYSFFNPRLQVHGVEIAIPGVNHKELSPALAQAYRLILEGKYGQAAKIILEQGVKAGKEGSNMIAFLNKKVEVQLKNLDDFIELGHWQEVNEFFVKQSAYWSGVPKFDEKQNFFKSLLTDAGGKKVLNADQMFRQGYYGQALKLAEQASVETSLEEVKKASAKMSLSINKMASEFIMKLKHMEVKGEWYTLYGHLKKLPKTYGGIPEVDKLAGKLMPPFKEPSGKALTLAHKAILETNFSKAYKSILQIEKQTKVVRHKKIASKVKEFIFAETAKKVSELKRIKQSGKWSTLYSSLTKAVKSYGGITEFNNFYKETVPQVRSSSGRVLVSVEKLLISKKYSMASKGLIQIRDNAKSANEIKSIANMLLDQISKEVQPLLKKIDTLEKDGDWYALQQEVRILNRSLNGVELFDKKRSRLESKFRESNIRNIINAGQEFEELKSSYLKRKTAGRIEKLKKFQKENASNFYGKKAKELLSK